MRPVGLEQATATGRLLVDVARPGAVLSIVVPTFNEEQNVGALVGRLTIALGDVDWEVVFVDDDSPDGTAERVRAMAQRDGRIRCVQRLDRRGLSSACIEGALASSAPFIAVMDADLQHDEALLPAMLGLLRAGDADVVVGSRYVEGGGFGTWSADRVRISRLATWLSRLVLKTEIRDPMSGFFMLRRDTFEQAMRGLSAVGFKILVDLLASLHAPPRVVELPYTFRARHAGESKLDNQAAWDFGMLLADKIVGRWVPVRFIAFAFVGVLGVAVHLAILTVLFRGVGLGFVVGQTVATGAAMTCNFAINNALTYRDVQLRGWGWLRGWASFCLACSVGAFANVGVASYIFEQRETLWALAAVAGIVVGAVWNYAVTAFYTWPRRVQARKA